MSRQPRQMFPPCFPRCFLQEAHRFVLEVRAFTGAEKALLACIALALLLSAGGALRRGSERAGDAAQRTLARGEGGIRPPSGSLGKVMSAGQLPQARRLMATPQPLGASGSGSTQTMREPVAPPLAAPAATGNGWLGRIGSSLRPILSGNRWGTPSWDPQRFAPPRPLTEGQRDVAYDGAVVGASGKAYPAHTPLGQIPAVRPADGRAPQGTIVYVNGILTDKATQARSLQNIANKTGAQVLGIHNATEGAVRDLAQCAEDKANLGKNPAVDTLSDTIYASVTNGQSIHIMGHSQGGLITSRALGNVKRRLMIEDGMSRLQAERVLSLAKIETFGAAAYSYPSGPRYVHYVNRFDPVPVEFGLGSTRLGNWFAGRGAEVRRFNEFHLNPVTSHSFDEVYLPHRKPFGPIGEVRHEIY